MADMNSPFQGTWSYRSFLNNPDLSVEFNALAFGLAELVICQSSLGVMTGTLGGEGWSLELKGWLTYGNPNMIRFQGSGDVDGELWVYDYLGFLTPPWPNGVNQRPAIVGTIVRTIPHSKGLAPAGDVASWIAVKQDGSVLDVELD